MAKITERRRIDLILPAQRWRLLADAIASIEATAAMPEQITVYLGIDPDARIPEDLRAKLDTSRLGIEICQFDERPPTLGALSNALADRGTGDVLLMACDDMGFQSKAWDAELHVHDAMTPGHWIGFLTDQAQPGVETYFAMPRRTKERLGRFVEPIFPYWFADTWWAEVAEGAGVKHKFKSAVGSLHRDGKGKTTRMRNVCFWANYYAATIDLRRQDVRRITARTEFADALAIQQKYHAALAHMRDPFGAIQIEAQFGEVGEAERFALEFLESRAPVRPAA